MPSNSAENVGIGSSRGGTASSCAPREGEGGQPTKELEWPAGVAFGESARSMTFAGARCVCCVCCVCCVMSLPCRGANRRREFGNHWLVSVFPIHVKHSTITYKYSMACGRGWNFASQARHLTWRAHFQLDGVSEGMLLPNQFFCIGGPDMSQGVKAEGGSGRPLVFFKKILS